MFRLVLWYFRVQERFFWLAIANFFLHILHPEIYFVISAVTFSKKTHERARCFVLKMPKWAV